VFDRIYGCFDGIWGSLMCVQGSMWDRKPTLMTICDSWLCAHNLVCCLSAQCISFTYMCTCNIYVHICVHTFILYANYGYARTTWSVIYLHNVLYLHICVHLVYVYIYEYTHIFYMRSMAMRARPGLLLICTMYCIYIYVYM